MLKCIMKTLYLLVMLVGLVLTAGGTGGLDARLTAFPLDLLEGIFAETGGTGGFGLLSR